MNNWRNNMPVQAFRLESRLLDSVSEEEVTATFSDMMELGIAIPPYDRFDLIVSGASVLGPDDKVSSEKQELMRRSFCDWEVYFRFNVKPRLGLENDFLEDLVIRANGRYFSMFEAAPELRKSAVNCAGWVYKVLLVLLATHNIKKSVRMNKAGKLGIGKKKAQNRHKYTTTLSIGKVIEKECSKGGEATGRTVRPHLRRGHIRRQKYVPSFEFVKKIFINPVFVNADEKWIGERTAYNCKLTVGE
jgi:hypothetical protein